MEAKGQISALVLSTIAMVISFAVWSVISPIATSIQEVYHISEIEKSLLVVTPVVLGSFMRIPMGILADRYGGRKIYTLTMLFLVIPMVGAGFVHSYSVLLFWTFLIGMAGATFAIAVTYVTRWFPPEKQGLVLGITGIGNLGTAVAGFTVPSVFNMFGLSWVFWGLAVAISLMALIFWVGTKELPKPREVKTFKKSLAVTKYKKTWVLSLFYFLTFGGFVAFSLYLPTILQDAFHLSAVNAGLKVSGFVIIATLIRPLGGYAADRFRPTQVLTLLFTGIVICATGLAFTTNHFTWFTVFCLLMASLLGAGNGAVFKLVPEVSPNDTGAVTGIVSAVGGIGGFFPPVALGVIKGITGSYGVGFVLLAFFALVCIVAVKLSFKNGKRKKLKVRYQEVSG